MDFSKKGESVRSVMGQENLDQIDTSEKGTQSQKPVREIVFLAEQSVDGDLRVLPGTRWGFHYSISPEERAEKIKGLKEGKYTAREVEPFLRPDTLVFNVEDIGKLGIEQISSRIRDLSAFVAHYDYDRLVEFLETVGDRAESKAVDDIYDDITRTRTQQKMMDSYGDTGRRQIEGSLRHETEEILSDFGSESRPKRILGSLKLDWLSGKKGVIDTTKRDRAVSELSGEEREVFESLRKAYREFSESGDEESFQTLIRAVSEMLPKIERETTSGDQSSSMQDLEKELEPVKEKVGPPGTSKDPGIPPEDSDEYHTPKESLEMRGERSAPFYVIEPPLAGYYASGRKSYYERESRTWNKKKELHSYDSKNSEKEDRHTISGITENGLKAIPLPVGYGLDVGSLKFEGTKPEILRDQNGCFYIQTTGPCKYSIDFACETTRFESQPIAADKEKLYDGQLSQDTEQLIQSLSGDSLHMAEQIRQHILAHHFYPGGGDITTAQALQYKLRNDANSENYIARLDTSEYLECYSANTLFISLLRKVGIPARLVIGHRVQGSKDGKSFIDASTGHAWTEIRDGKSWRRIDATPNPKPEDITDEQKKEREGIEEASEANDGGIEPPDKSQPGKSKQKEGDQSGEIGDAEVQKGTDILEQAKRELEQTIEQRSRLEQSLAEAKNFNDLSELQRQIQESDLFEDMKKELGKRLADKVEQMRDEVKDLMDQIVDDGFMDDEVREILEQKLNESDLQNLDQIRQEIERENKLHEEYEKIREEVSSLVEDWYKYFAEKLPTEEEVSVDEDSTTRQGVFDRRAAQRPHNLIFGTVKSPRQIKPSIKPKFIASLLIDVSGSMQGEKLHSARRLAVFFSELFSRISEEFGYIRFSIGTFSDGVQEIKTYDQEYNSPTRYDYSGGERQTVKTRLMESLVIQGGTNMLDAVRAAADGLNKETTDYPDYSSALYFVGDGEDTCGNSENIRNFLRTNDAEHGFGEHMKSAILLGGESQRQELAAIFGDEHTTVVPDFDELIETSMKKFDDDIEDYLRDKTL